MPSNGTLNLRVPFTTQGKLFLEASTLGTRGVANLGSRIASVGTNVRYSIIVCENKIVAFSSILNRNYWPKNVARIFNRFWRNKNYSWSNPTFGILSQLMYDHQVEYCRDKGFDYVFLSTDKTPRHLQRWSQQ